MQVRLAKRQLQSRLAHDVVGRRWKRRARRATKDESPPAPLEEESEVRAATLADAPHTQRARAEATLIEEAAHPLEDD